VYLVMKNGDVKRAASNAVFLLPDTITVRLAVARKCQLYFESGRLLHRVEGLIHANDFALSQKLLDSAKVLDSVARRDLDDLVPAGALASAPTDVNGHYRFASVPPSKYILWARTTIGDSHYAWWATVTLAPGDSMRRDLDNKVASDFPECRIEAADSIRRADSAQEYRRDSAATASGRAQRRVADSVAAWVRVHTISGDWSGYVDTWGLNLSLKERPDSTLTGSGDFTEGQLSIAADVKGRRTGPRVTLLVVLAGDTATYMGSRTSADVLTGTFTRQGLGRAMQLRR
jgi:hypothetical protein